MVRTAKDITDTELQVINVLWERGACTVREVCSLVYPEGTPSYYASTQTMLERLEQKKYVVRNRDAYPHRFKACVSRDEVIGRRLQATADKLCEGSLAPLLTHLVKAKLSVDQRGELRKLINEIDSSKGE